ncbi:hypothetical protein A0U92_16805 [Acetobacter aceti]|uniref:Uncharacterized protein n=2 Tax=Acetobacter aceti TaxID=435 RepID=A0A1U9KK70_ACEAC|nr:hypothetical protein A0U92_16805 [Acetobacter aceti]
MKSTPISYFINPSETSTLLASHARKTPTSNRMTSDEKSMSGNILRLPHCPEASPILISHSLLQLADVVWQAGLPGLANDLVSLAHSAIDRPSETTL